MCDCRYDYTLFFSFIVLVPCAFVLAVLSKIRHTMEVITKPRKTDDALEQRQRAFDLQVPCSRRQYLHNASQLSFLLLLPFPLLLSHFHCLMVIAGARAR